MHVARPTTPVCGPVLRISVSWCETHGSRFQHFHLGFFIGIIILCNDEMPMFFPNRSSSNLLPLRLISGNKVFVVGRFWSACSHIPGTR